MIADEPLTDEQVELLRLIWWVPSSADQIKLGPDWPTWDFVQRSLYRRFPDIPDAATVLASLPRILDVDRVYGRSRSYGLAWHTGHMAMNPAPEDRLGLTILGMVRLAE